MPVVRDEYRYVYLTAPRLSNRQKRHYADNSHAAWAASDTMIMIGLHLMAAALFSVIVIFPEPVTLLVVGLPLLAAVGILFRAWWLVADLYRIRRLLRERRPESLSRLEQLHDDWGWLRASLDQDSPYFEAVYPIVDAYLEATDSAERVRNEIKDTLGQEVAAKDPAYRELCDHLAKAAAAQLEAIHQEDVRANESRQAEQKKLLAQRAGMAIDDMQNFIDRHPTDPTNP